MNTDNNILKYIIFILDTSGSMNSFGNETIHSLKKLIKEQQQTGVEFMFTLITCGEKVKFACKNALGSEIGFSDEENLESAKVIINVGDLEPGGMTPLLDAIGTAVNYQKKIETSNVLVVILTDGNENSSKEYTSADIQKLNKEMETEYKWKYIYLGANQDSFETRNSLGIKPLAGATSNYDATPFGLRDVMGSLSANLSRCITTTNERVEDFSPTISTSYSTAPQTNIDQPNSLIGNSFPSLEPSYSVGHDFHFVSSDTPL